MKITIKDDARQWNLGGERLWIAPEIQFHIMDRDNFWESIKNILS